MIWGEFMKRAGYDEVREERIMMEATVDAHDDEERAMGWYYYLDDKASFPFGAVCIKRMKKSPLREGEHVNVLQMADEDDCMHEMYVEIDWDSRQLSVPLEQLMPIGTDDMTTEAVEDWHYWTSQGYEL